MIVDPKIQNMFDRCREQKRHIDKMIRVTRAALFVPPALLAVYMVINIAASMLQGMMMSFLGDVTGSAFGPLGLIMAVVLAGFAAGETMLDIQKLKNISTMFYPAAAGACVLLGLISGSERGMLFLLALFCIAAIPVNILFKKFCADDELMKPMKGYPHFNTLLMTERDFREPEPEGKPPEEMTPDERLMYERDHNR